MNTKQLTTDLGHGISLIDAEYMKRGIAAIYLVQQGDRIAIIETGTAHSVDNIMQVIEQRGLSAEHVDYVIPTHVHLDHAGGVGELMSRCQNAQLVIHPFGARHMIDPSKLQAGTIAVYGEDRFHQMYGELKPVDEDRVIEAADNFILDFNGRSLRFLDTPGHARHHFCVYDETSAGIFTGDTFGLCYPQLDTEQGHFIFATTTPVQFDPPALLDSIDRLMSLNPQAMYLTHFGRVEPTQQLVKQLKASIETFSEIALDEASENEDRLERIKRRMMDYLLDELFEMNCHLDPSACRELLENDVDLNSQGLEVWLSKQRA